MKDQQLSLFGEEKEETCKASCDAEISAEDVGIETKTSKEPKDKLPDYPRVVCYVGRQKTFPPEMSLEQIRKELQKVYPELRKGKTDMQYETKSKTVMVYPVVKAAKAG